MFCLALRVNLSHKLLKQIYNLELISYIHSVSGKYQFILLAVSMEKLFLVWTEI